MRRFIIKVEAAFLIGLMFTVSAFAAVPTKSAPVKDAPVCMLVSTLQEPEVLASRERIEALGGTFTAGPRAGAGGWRVFATVPKQQGDEGR